MSSYEELQNEIRKLGRFQSLVQFPEKRDPDWPKWAARATVPGADTDNGIMATGATDLEALEHLAAKLKEARPPE